MAKKITEAELKELKANACGILSECRRVILTRFPFSGSVMTTMDLVPIRDLRCSTACTDGKSIYFDIEFLSKLNDAERMFVLSHELWHSVLMHFLRTESRDRQLFNVATDLEVNQLLREEGMAAPTEVLFPEPMGLPTGKNAEEYYELLLNKAKKNSTSQGGEGGSGGQSSGSGNSKSNSKLKGQFDKHVFDKDNVESEKDGAGTRTDKYGEVGFDDDFNPQQDEATMEKVREAAVQAIQQIERSRGEVPGYLKNLATKLLDAKMPWQELLCQFITRSIGDGKTSWSKPNRRHVYNGTYLPSRYSDKIKIAVGIDTSGSTSGDIPRFLGELNGLVKTFGDYELHIIQCDTTVAMSKAYSNDDPLDLENEQFEVSGYGGTYLHPIFEHIADNDIDPSAILILTDGEIEEFPEGDAPDVPVLWAISHGCMNAARHNIHFGELVELEKSCD